MIVEQTSKDLLDHTIFNEKYINSLFDMDKLSIIEWFAKRELMKNEMLCLDCHSEMKLSKKSSAKLGYVWICKNPCRKTLSVTHGSYFKNIHIPIKDYLLFIYKWSRNTLLIDIQYELGICRNTTIEMAKDMREICAIKMLDEVQSLGGYDENGQSKICEMDESMWGNRKYNVGRIHNAHWVVGIIERGSNKSILVPVENRNTTTLVEIILKYILPGTIIVTDGWKGYIALGNDPAYIHKVVIHKYNFVSPEDSKVHTQNIECLWSHAKRKNKNQYGTYEEYLENYLFEYTFRRYYGKNNVFKEIMFAIAEYI